MNISTIEWKSPIIEYTPSIPRELHSNFLEGIDKNRICEVEEVCDEWILYKYFDRLNRVEIDTFAPQLTLEETRCSGVDIVHNKTNYNATAIGNLAIIVKSFD